METETLHRGRIAVTNPMDDTHKTFKHLKKAGITEAQAEVFTETFKGLSDQTIQVNENLLLVRDELLGVITGIHLKLKDIDHKIDSNYQGLDHKIDAKFSQAQISNARWNIGMFVGTVTMFIGLSGLIIALD